MEKKLVCPICKTEFVTDKNAMIYCGIKCRRKAVAMAAKERNAQEIHYCEWCGKSFTGRKKKYCNENCRLRANGRKKWERTTASEIPYDGLTFEQADMICKKKGISYGEFTRLKMMQEVERERANGKRDKVQAV